MNNGLTIKDATERWVHEMNAIPTGMIEKMMEADIDVGEKLHCRASAIECMQIAMGWARSQK